MGQRQLESLYCDDIRQEIGGKVSYIGIYNGQMWVQSFPVTLPKLCVAYKIVIPNDRPVETLTVRIFRDEEILFEATGAGVPDPMASEDVRRKMDEGIETVTTVQNGVIFSPLVIDAPCRIRLRVTTSDGDELKATGLEIRQPPEEFAPPVL